MQARGQQIYPIFLLPIQGLKVFCSNLLFLENNWKFPEYHYAFENMNTGIISTEAVARRCSVREVFLEILENSQEKTCARVPFLIKLQAQACNFIRKETLAQAFSCEFSEISKNTYSYRAPPWLRVWVFCIKSITIWVFCDVKVTYAFRKGNTQYFNSFIINHNNFFSICQYHFCGLMLLHLMTMILLVFQNVLLSSFSL